jgi:hypothetical protein
MSINIDSEAWCRKAYLNYHCYDNSMGLTVEEMAEITSKWERQLPSWQRSVSSDETEYDFDDSEFENYKESGKKSSEDATGYSASGGKNTGNKIRSGVDCAIGGVSLLAETGGMIVGKLGGQAAGTAVNNAVNVAANKVTGGAAGKLSTKAGGKAKASDILTITLAVATNALYWLKRPNKSEKKACDALQDVMTDNQGALEDAQGEMATMSGELIELTDEANEANEDANDKIKKAKTIYDMHKSSYLILKDKIDAGIVLTESEKELYTQSVKNMSKTSANITSTEEDASGTIGEIYDDMGTYQDGYDYAAETMGEVQGSTDYAESFDDTTKTLCKVEGAGMTMTAGATAIAAARVASKAFVGWFFAALGTAAAVSSGYAAAEQFKWAGEVGDEIGMRKYTQDMNDATMEMYDEEIDSYDGFMQDIGDLEIEEPDDIEPPENAADPNTNSDPTVPTGTPDPLNPTGVKKKEDEKE